MWNNHRIRPVKNSECPSGQSEILYFAPHLSGSRDCIYSVTETDVNLTKSYSEDPIFSGCSKEFLELSTVITKGKGINMPKSTSEAKTLVKVLIKEINLL